MSSGNRVPLAEAKEVAEDMLEYLQKIPGHYTIAGSVRRRKPSVGDIEIVCLPNNKGDLLNRLDVLERNNIVKKAIYGNTTRWGDSLRGMIFQRMQVEIVVADADNFGYKLWLHTGPGDKNKFVMTQMIIHKTPIRFAEGYAWHVQYDDDLAGDYRKLAKLHVPDEWKLYHLLGMTEILPWDRTELTYRMQIGRTMRHLPEEEIKAMYAKSEQQIPKQLSLFD